MLVFSDEGVFVYDKELVFKLVSLGVFSFVCIFDVFFGLMVVVIWCDDVNVWVVG